VWSFALKAIGVLFLRFQRNDQEYKFPLNLRLGRVEIPIGLGLTTLFLFAVAIANLLSKKIATIYGVSFTILLFTVFLISERINLGRRQKAKGLEQFNLEHQAQVDTHTVSARPGCILVAVRDYRRMTHLKKVLEKTNTRRHDIVVMTVRQVSTGSGEYDLHQDQIFSDYEQELFSHVVTAAEKQGKHVDLLVVPPHGSGMGKASRAAAPILPRGDQSRPAFDVRESWTAPAAAMAGGSRPATRPVARS
jgi:hypothetical protein